MADRHQNRIPNPRLTIGMLADSLDNQYQHPILSGVVDAAEARDVNLLCFSGKVRQGLEAQDNKIYHLASNETIEGLVVISDSLGNHVTPEEYKHFFQSYSPLPIVGIGRKVEGNYSVLVDQVQGLRELLAHLIDTHGYRRIAFIRGPDASLVSEIRYGVYSEVLAEHGLKVDPELVTGGDFEVASGAAAIALLLDERKVKFEAVMAANDNMALGALAALQARGIRVPDEVAVAGFDDVEQDVVVTPPLTTVKQPLYEQGWQAVEILVDTLQGKKVSEQTILPSEMVVRQSCGCPSQVVLQASAEMAAPTAQNFEIAFVAQRDDILTEIAHIMEHPVTNPTQQRVGQLLDAFIAELEDQSSDSFLPTLNEVLRQVIGEGGDLVVWQKALSVLQHRAMPVLSNNVKSLLHANKLWQQSRVLIAEVAQRAEAYHMLQAEQQVNVLNEINQALVTTFDVVKLMNTVAQEIPRLEIPRCYLALYEGTETPPEWSTLVLAYNEHERVTLAPDQQRFPSRRLVPPELWPQERRYTFMIEPLYFQDNALGFVLFEAGPRHGQIYETLRGQISSALQGALLMKQEERRARQLQAVAEVSTATSTILDTAIVLQKTVDLTKERFGLYHTHVYLLNETGNVLNLAAGAGEAGRKMMAEGWRIPLLRKKSLVAQAARTGHEIMVNNVHAAPDWLPNPLLPDTRSELAVPLIVGDKVLGVFDVQADTVDHFTVEDIGIYTTLAAQVAATLQNVNLYAETTQRATELGTLSQISRRLSAMLDPEKLISAVVEQIGTAFNYYYTQIYLFDEARENLVVAGGTGELGQRLVARQHSLPKGRGLVGRAAEQNKIVLVPDVQRHVGVEIVTQANVDGIYQREVDPAVEDEWYARYITEHFGDVKALVDWLNMISEDQAGPSLKLGYVLHVGGVFPKMMQRGVEAAARDLQIEIDLVAPNRESEHLPLFEEMVARGVDGLVVVPDKPEWIAPIEQAMAAGIPVVTANRDLKSSPALMHVGLDNFQAGIILARELAGLLSQTGQDEGKILVSTGVADRLAGVRHSLRRSNYTLIEIEGFLEEASFLKTYWEQAINHHPDAIAVIGLTVSEAPILAEIKRHLGGQWLVGGFDLELETLDAIRDGTVQVTIGQHTYLQAYLPILALVEHIRQETPLQGWMAEGWLPNALLPQTKTEVAVPIALGGEVLGVLDVQNNIAGSLKPENANLLHSVGDQVAVALTNARLFEETTRSKEEAELAQEKAEQARAEAEQAQREIEIANKTLKVQMWQTKGQAELNDKMRGEQELATLADNVIRQLCHYLEAQIGALYVAQDQNLNLIGSYAYNSKKPTTHFKFGQGLVGQAAVEKKLLLISNVPNDYITISSGWGETVPRHILVFPFLYEGHVTGVVELGTLTAFNQTQLDFMEIALGSIAIAFNTAQARARINELLAETQQQAEELQVQGEELRVANEELQAQTESLQVSEAKLREQQAELETTNTQLEEKAAALQESSAALKEKQAILDQQNRELIVAQQELERKAKELALASKYKSEFLANMSHELRTPLNSLLILARMLADNKEGNLTGDQVESAQIIYSGGTDLLNLINDILDLSKVEAGQMLFTFDAMPLTDLVSTMRMQFDHVAQEKGLDFIITLAEDLPGRIKTDQQRVKQIVKNLLSNAFKFTKQGRVSLNVYRPGGKVDLSRSGLDPSQAIAISVADTGIGMTPEQQRIVFEAFQQADGSTSRQYGGTGLGLSISRELSAKLGGQIALESEPGQGSTFTLYLPIERGKADEIEIAQKAQPVVPIKETPPPKPATPPQPAAPPVPRPVPPVDDRAELTTAAKQSEGVKILAIIEDDPKFAKVVYNYAHKKGFKCLIAGEGKTGIELVESYRPEAIILDLNLPDMSGWEVLAILKNDPETRHIPIHIMSVDDEALDAYRRGAMGYLTKPVQQESLDKAFDKIEGLISRDIKNLLLVEDDANSRLSIKKLLDGSDVHITEAEQGQVALELLETQPFDCMILDLSLPDMSGFEVLSKMNKNGTITRCPVIIYTGRELTPEENAELMQYADSVIVKGVKSPERLLDETALFLHRVVADMPREKQQTIKQLYNKDDLLKDKRVLIVDDDMRNSFALSKLLSDKGIIVKIAKDGQKALDLLAEDPDVDLILMDIMMPVLDGYETTKRIRAQRKFNNLPILALTAKAMKGDREKCLDAGANDYLPKPVDVDRLFSMLRVWLYQ